MMYFTGFILAFIVTLGITTYLVLDGWTKNNSDRGMFLFFLVLVGTVGSWFTILGLTIVGIVKKIYKKYNKEKDYS